MLKTVALCLLHCLNGEVRFRKWFTKRAYAYALAQEAHDAREWYCIVSAYYPKIERPRAFSLDLHHSLPSNCDRHKDDDMYVIMNLSFLCNYCSKQHLDYRPKVWKECILKFL